MALVRIDHVPATVKVSQPLCLVIPDPGPMGEVPVRMRKVLYLLHGLSDDASAWQRFSSIETVASAYGLVVVMPSAGRSFYIDQPNGQQYFTYIAEELPRYLSDVFDLRPKREDTLIAGISMGGYGTLKAALLHPELYCAAACFSGVLSLEVLSTHADDARKEEFRFLFGDLSGLRGGEHDPAVWLRRAARNPAALPRLFVSCGRQDDLYPLSRAFPGICASLGIPVEYHEEDGKHDWFFWDNEIKRFLRAVLGDPPQT
jgi:S-formylglutathione hydrolase FrmB